MNLKMRVSLKSKRKKYLEQLDTIRLMRNPTEADLQRAELLVDIILDLEELLILGSK